ncbi:urease accessory protein UreD [Rhodobacteraceae bacterium NNCM2]|nr:urease accessory protein UreD [Coraliihabitans acroporae]
MMGRETGARAPGPQRARGLVRVRARHRNGVNALADLRQQGSAKAFFPRHPGDACEGVLLNTAGGITGGDRFTYAANADDGAWLSLSTQAAERAYRAEAGETGHMDVSLTLGAGARIDWLPQETILYDGASLARRLDVSMAPGSRLLAVEPIVFGRRAMGERVRDLCFTDQWRVRRGGVLVYADALRLVGDAEAQLARAAIGAGAGAMASLVYIAPDAEARLAPLRALLPESGGASLIREGVLAARLLAPDGRLLRDALIPMLEALRGDSLPKVWTM